MNMIPGPGGLLVPDRALKVVIFKTSGFFTWPKGVEVVYVTMIGGGGPGGAATTAGTVRAGAGGSGELMYRFPYRRFIDGLTSRRIAVTVGAGGTTTAGSVGTKGGDSQFGQMKVEGGFAGTRQAGGTAVGSGAGGGYTAVGAATSTASGAAGTWSQQFWLGGNSGASHTSTTTGSYPFMDWDSTNGAAAGANSFFGIGGAGLASAGDGNNAPVTSYGAGGGAAFGGGAVNRIGGSGAPGIVIVEY